jgi:TIR domain
MANVFVSHRAGDADRARKLAEAVRAAGHAVWLDEWKIGLGDSIVERIDGGLTGSSYVVVCYSSLGVMSPWMSREWMSALARQLDGHRVRLLPLRLSGGEPPALLADIKYADLVADWDGGVRQLLAAIR